LTLGADGAMKMGWNAGDRIFVAKGEKVYIYKLSSTGSDGKGVFTAEGKGVPDLTGNTEKVSIYHLGTGLNVDYVKTTNNLSNLSVEIGGGTQTENGTFAHLAKDCILERVLETAPTTVEELEGTLKPKTSILTFNIPAPTTLAEGEIPTSAILTVCSYNTSFAGSLKATDQGVTIEQSVKKLEVKLKETGNWNASTPLKVSFNVLMDNNSHTAGSDAWIVEVQTNKRKLYTSEKLTIKNKPAVGAYYNASITSVKEETSLPCYATFEDDINAIKKEIHAVFQDSYSCAYNYSFLNQVYASILIEDESGNPVFDYYVESGKGGEGGKGGAFLGDGFVNIILYPGKTYTITPYIVIEQNIVYFGTAKSYTPTEYISFASGDLGLSVIWADKNVGADNTEDVGGYYAWGVTDEYAAPFTYKWFNEDGSKAKKYVSQNSHSESGTADGLTVLVAADDVASAESKGEWRMPTKEEIDELKKLDCLEGYELNGKKGLLFVGNGVYKYNALFFPYGGYKDNSDTPTSTEYAYIWSSSLVTASSSAPEYIDYGAYTLQNIVEGHVGWKTTDIAALRSSARNVRGVKARPSAE
ncbi:MAG: hypothetical protein SPG81_05350, partial [Candidatus Egerieousia sp.]|nr:hypothetical protein [Candidatus Egerieousia sp.]